MHDTDTPTTEQSFEDKLKRMQERDERTWAKCPTDIPACPDWCRKPAGHRYDSALFDEVTFSRFHDSGPDDRVSLTQEELNQGGQVTLQKLVITSWDDDGSSEYSAAAARERARLLLAVADERDRITGAAS